MGLLPWFLRDAKGSRSCEYSTLTLSRMMLTQQGLTTPFLTLLTNLLYTQPLLLSPLLRGLSQLVSSNQRLAASSTESPELIKTFGMDQEQAKANIGYLKTLAKDMVSVLLNVFSKLPREQRGQVGEVIGAWVGIMTEQVSTGDTPRILSSFFRTSLVSIKQ